MRSGEDRLPHIVLYHYSETSAGEHAVSYLNGIEDGANVSMIVYTMVEMVKAHRLHPYNYLKYLLDNRPGINTTDAEFEDLASWNEKAG